MVGDKEKREREERRGTYGGDDSDIGQVGATSGRVVRHQHLPLLPSHSCCMQTGVKVCLRKEETQYPNTAPASVQRPAWPPSAREGEGRLPRVPPPAAPPVSPPHHYTQNRLRTPKMAQEKSSLSLMLVEMAVRRRVLPICSAMPMNLFENSDSCIVSSSRLYTYTHTHTDT